MVRKLLTTMEFFGKINNITDIRDRKLNTLRGYLNNSLMSSFLIMNDIALFILKCLLYLSN